jgi:hypothetical protein
VSELRPMPAAFERFSGVAGRRLDRRHTQRLGVPATRSVLGSRPATSNAPRGDGSDVDIAPVRHLGTNRRSPWLSAPSPVAGSGCGRPMIGQLRSNHRDDDLLTVAEAALIAHRSVRTLRRGYLAGRIVAHRDGNGRGVTIRYADLTRVADRRGRSAAVARPVMEPDRARRRPHGTRRAGPDRQPRAAQRGAPPTRDARTRRRLAASEQRRGFRTLMNARPTRSHRAGSPSPAAQ